MLKKGKTQLRFEARFSELQLEIEEMGKREGTGTDRVEKRRPGNIFSKSFI